MAKKRFHVRGVAVPIPQAARHGTLVASRILIGFGRRRWRSNSMSSSSFQESPRNRNIQHDANVTSEARLRVSTYRNLSVAQEEKVRKLHFGMTNGPRVFLINSRKI